MPHPTTISPLSLFRELFPDRRLSVEHEEELRYTLNTYDIAKAYKIVALDLIVGRRLPLTAEIEVWSVAGKLKAVELIIKPVPEEYTFDDEVQDDEHYDEEKAEWPY